MSDTCFDCGQPTPNQDFPGAEMAFYDENKVQITPWFPVGTKYVGRKVDNRKTVAFAAVRDGDIEIYRCVMTMSEGADHTVEFLHGARPVMTSSLLAEWAQVFEEAQA